MKHTLILLCLLVTISTSAQQKIDKTTVMELLQNQQYKEALDYIKPKIHPGNIQDISLYAYTSFLSGNLKDAINGYEQILSIDSNHVTAHQYLANLYQEKPAAALPHYEKLATLQPNNSNTLRQLAFCLFANKQPDTAFYFLNKAYSINPADPKTVARLSEDLTDKKNYQRADSILCAFMEKDTTQTPITMMGVRVAYWLKDYYRCTTLGDQLMREGFTSPNTFSYVISAWYNLKKYNDCIRVYDYLSSNNVTSEGITYYTALANTALKNYTESNSLLQTCIDMAMSKSLDDYYAGKSVNYEGLKQYKSAVATLDTAWYLFQQPLRQYSIGRIYDVQLKNKPAAIRYYKRYLQTAPVSPQEKIIRQYLESYIKK